MYIYIYIYIYVFALHVTRRPFDPAAGEHVELLLLCVIDDKLLLSRWELY